MDNILNFDAKTKKCLLKYLEYDRPDKYRAKIPGYEGVTNLVTVNKNMALKILKVKKSI